MKNYPQESPNAPLQNNKGHLPSWLAYAILIGGTLVILYTTLINFDFQFYSLSFAAYIRGFDSLPSSYFDFPRNILLFIPFGFGLAAVFDRRKYSKKTTFVVVLLASFLLTWFVESLQFFLPGRTPNVSDILANCLGGLAGSGLYWVLYSQKIKAASQKPRIVLLSAVIYFLFLLLLGAYLQNKTRLTEWDQAYTMLIGNEHTGNRPWKGTVTQLAIFDEGFSKNEAAEIMAETNLETSSNAALVAFYPLVNSQDLDDKVGNLPPFSWRGDSDTLDLNEIPNPDGQNWLETAQPPVYLAERLQGSSQFSIMITMATADRQQSGPARIFSYSFDPFTRNLTIGQDGHDLIVRLRTKMTGKNGDAPQLAIKDFFTSSEAQKVIISFDGLTLQTVGAGGSATRRIEIVPGITFLRSLMGGNDSFQTIGSSTAWLLNIAFYILFFIPLGACLYSGTKQIRVPARHALVVILGIILPPLILELVFTVRNGFELRFFSVFGGAVVIGLTYLALAFASRQETGSR